MRSKHGESHVCLARARRYGGRRRYCSVCGRTWTIHSRRPGRKRLRVEAALPQHLLVKHEPAGQFITRRHCSPSTFYEHSRRALARLARLPYSPPLSDAGDLILIVDGLWFTVRNVESVLYNLAARPIDSKVACLLDPVMLVGKEYEKTWREAIKTSVVPEMLPRIRALVADGFKGARAIAADHGWVYQRCHWHLLSTLGVFGVRKNRHLRGRVARDAATRLMQAILYERNEQLVQQLCADLSDLVSDRRLVRRRTRYVISNFLRDVDHFRAYLHHPELRLPTTTGTMESFHAKVRPIASRVNSIESILNRAKCLVRLDPTITCNGHTDPQN